MRKRKIKRFVPKSYRVEHKDEQVRFMLPAWMKTTLKEIAWEEKISMSELIRKVLNDFINEEPDEVTDEMKAFSRTDEVA